MKLRHAMFAASLFLASVAGAATSYPTHEDAKTMSGSYLDLKSCAFSEEAARAQLDTVLRVPDADRGAAIENGPCTVASVKPVPNTVDDRYRR